MPLASLVLTKRNAASGNEIGSQANQRFDHPIPPNTDTDLILEKKCISMGSGTRMGAIQNATSSGFKVMS